VASTTGTVVVVVDEGTVVLVDEADREELLLVAQLMESLRAPR